MRVNFSIALGATIATVATGGCSRGATPAAVSQSTLQELRSATQADQSSQRLYVPDFDLNQVSTYQLDGTQTSPTITKNLQGPEAVAVGPTGMIYVANGYGGTITTYTRDGKETKPTILVNGPAGLATDADGKIYVISTPPTESCGSGTLFTFQPDGTRTAPTIALPDDGPDAVVVDSKGKIYVAGICNGTFRL